MDTAVVHFTNLIPYKLPYDIVEKIIAHLTVTELLTGGYSDLALLRIVELNNDINWTTQISDEEMIDSASIRLSFLYKNRGIISIHSKVCDILELCLDKKLVEHSKTAFICLNNITQKVDSFLHYGVLKDYIKNNIENWHFENIKWAHSNFPDNFPWHVANYTIHSSREIMLYFIEHARLHFNYGAFASLSKFFSNFEDRADIQLMDSQIKLEQSRDNCIYLCKNLLAFELRELSIIIDTCNFDTFKCVWEGWEIHKHMGVIKDELFDEICWSKNWRVLDFLWDYYSNINYKSHIISDVPYNISLFDFLVERGYYRTNSIVYLFTFAFTSFSDVLLTRMLVPGVISKNDLDELILLMESRYYMLLNELAQKKNSILHMIVDKQFNRAIDSRELIISGISIIDKTNNHKTKYKEYVIGSIKKVIVALNELKLK